MSRLSPEEVFTPAAPAVDSIVYTHRRAPELVFRNILQEAGTQCLIYGDSAIGKTSFVLTELRRRNINHIRIQCSNKMTWNNISQEILRKLKEGIVRKITSTEGDNEKFSLNVYIAKFKAGVDFTDKIESELGGDIGTVTHITDILLQKKVNLIIDDFEKITSKTTKASISNLAKNLSDSSKSRQSPRVIVIGIADTADDLIEGDMSIASRLHPLHLPRMAAEELADIFTKGFRKLKIDIPYSNSKNISNLLGGFPKYAHAIGLELSRAYLSADDKRDLGSIFRIATEHFLDRYCAHVTAIFNKATVIRGRPKQEYILIIKGVAECGLQNGFSLDTGHDGLKEYIRKQFSGQSTIPQIDRIKFRNYLRILSSDARGAIFIRSSRTGRYYYKEPLMPIYILCATNILQS